MPVKYVYYDDTDPLRELCRCPKCSILWTHYEASSISGITTKHAEEWIRRRYAMYQCPECGTWSRLKTQARTFREIFTHWDRREICSPKESQQEGDT